MFGHSVTTTLGSHKDDNLAVSIIDTSEKLDESVPFMAILNVFNVLDNRFIECQIF